MKPTPEQIDKLRKLAMMDNKPHWYKLSITRVVKRGITEKQAAELIEDLEANWEPMIPR